MCVLVCARVCVCIDVYVCKWVMGVGRAWVSVRVRVRGSLTILSEKSMQTALG